MTRLFALSALLPALALARGTDDGSSRDNAFSSYVINKDETRLDFHVWNEYDSTHGW